VTSHARTMRAMLAASSDPASLSCQRIPVPSPGRGDVLVDVRATAVTADELTWPENWPAIPCHDVSGVVAAAGPGVAGWRRGDEVFGLIGFDRAGAAADFVAVPAVDLAAKPRTVNHVAAAAVPLAALTAWQALHEHARLRRGQRVLIHGGAGGVGAYAVQLAALHGARVSATASARDAAFVAALGAGQVIDYTGHFEDQVHDVDVIIDPVGGGAMARSWQVLRRGGILVAIAEQPPEGGGGRHGARGAYFVVRPDGGQLRRLAVLIDKQQLRPVVSAIFELSALRDAFRAQRARREPGKVVVTVASTAGS